MSEFGRKRPLISVKWEFMGVVEGPLAGQDGQPAAEFRYNRYVDHQLDKTSKPRIPEAEYMTAADMKQDLDKLSYRFGIPRAVLEEGKQALDDTAKKPVVSNVMRLANG